MLAVVYSFTFTAVHIPGVRNEQADALSRSELQTFFRAVPTADPIPVAVPRHLVSELLFPPWMKLQKTF